MSKELYIYTKNKSSKSSLIEFNNYPDVNIVNAAPYYCRNVLSLAKWDLNSSSNILSPIN